MDVSPAEAYVAFLVLTDSGFGLHLDAADSTVRVWIPVGLQWMGIKLK